VAQCLIEQDRDVRVMQRVDRLAPRAIADDEAQAAQDPQLLRHRRLSHHDGGAQLGDAARPLAEATQDLHPARRRQAGHQRRDLRGALRIDAGLRCDPMDLAHALMLSCASMHVYANLLATTECIERCGHPRADHRATNSERDWVAF
jgi:hypothetical protein